MSTPLKPDQGSAPPWILGHRGVPREAPENTLSSLRRALAVGLDGFEYDMHACRSGEAILLHDESLDRTTDAHGLLCEKTLPELAGIDAGSWFDRGFRGEPLPLFEEALALSRSASEAPPLHMIELKERGLVAQVAMHLRQQEPPLSVRVASFLRDVVLEARDHGLPAMLLAEHASEADREFVRRERLAAYGLGPGGWRNAAGSADWSFCERWGWSIDLPEDLLEACRAPYFGFNTNEPYRALATRALVQLAPHYTGPYPIQAPALVVEPETLPAEVRARGEWFGDWQLVATVTNPFEQDVAVACELRLQGGAFDQAGLPKIANLAPGASLRLAFRLTGGSRSPGNDPLLRCTYRLARTPESGPGELTLDAPLTRVRYAQALTSTVRLPLLAEHPEDRPAAILLRRRGASLLLSLEGQAGLEQAHIVAHLDGEVVRGGSGLRLRLPPDFDTRRGGLPFSCGIEGKRGGLATIRRWAGGLPEGIFSGRAGRLLAAASS